MPPCWFLLLLAITTLSPPLVAPTAGDNKAPAVATFQPGARASRATGKAQKIADGGVCFQVTQNEGGDCTITSNGRCVSSKGFPSAYGKSDSCTLSVPVGISLSWQDFSTEATNDVVTMANYDDRFSGEVSHNALSRLETLGAAVTWTTNARTVKKGWKFCIPLRSTKSKRMAAQDRQASGQCRSGVCLTTNCCKGEAAGDT
jgi:hypothetical protein